MKFARSCTRLCCHWLWQCLVGVFVLLAVLVTLCRLAFPWVEREQEQLLAMLNERLPFLIELEQAELSWHKLGPRINVERLSLINKDGGALLSQATNIDVSFNLLASLFYQRPVTQKARVGNVEVQLASKEGVFYLGDLAFKSTGRRAFNFQVLYDTLVKQRLIEIDTAHVVFTFQQQSFQQDWQLAINDFHYIGGAKRQQFVGDVYIGDVAGDEALKLVKDNQLHLIGLNRGNLVDVEGRNISLYLRADQLDATSIMAMMPTADFVVDSGQISAEFWLDFKADHFDKASSRMIAKALQGRSSYLKQPLDLSYARFTTHLTSLNRGFQLDVGDIHFSLNQHDSLYRDLAFRFQQHSGKQNIKIASRQLDLGVVYQLLADMVADKVTSRIPRFDGLVSQASLQLWRQKTSDWNWQANAHVDEINVEGSGKRPGLTLRGAAIAANPQGGKLSLDDAIAVHAGELFSHELVMNKPIVEAKWQKRQQQWLAEFLWDGSVRSVDTTGSGRLQLEKGKPPSIELYAEATSGDGKEAATFFPDGIMPDQLVEYLSGSIRGGTVKEARVLWHGPVTAFPYTENQGKLHITGQVSDGTYQIGPGWPTVQGKDVYLSFTHQGMDIHVKGGNASGAKVLKADITLPRYLGGELQVKAQAKASSANAKTFFAQSPLSFINKALEPLSINARGDLDIDIRIPLEDLEATRVAGRFGWQDGDFSVKDSPWRLAALNGELVFSEQHLESTALNGRLWDKYPVQAQLSYQRSRDTDVMVHLAGSASVADIARAYPHKAWSRLAGDFDYQADIEVDRDSVLVTVNSDLQGVKSLFPAPLTKTQDEAAEFRFILEREHSSGQLLTESRFNQQRIYFDWSDKLERLLVNPASQWGAPRSLTGVYIGGNYAYLNVDDWLDVAPLFDNSVEHSSVIRQPPAIREAVADLKQVDVSSHELSVFEHRLTAAEGEDYLRLQSNGTNSTHLPLNVTSRELIGELTLPLQPDLPLVADMELVRFDVENAVESAPSQRSLPQKGGESQFWPAELWDMQVTVDKLVVDQRDLGQLSLKGQRVSDSYKWKDIILALPELHRLQAQLTWQKSLHEESLLSLDLDTQALGSSIGRLIGVDSGITKSEGSIRSEVRWEGAPWELSLEKLVGKATVDLGKGSLKDVSDQGARILSLLSLSTITRRLTLDFSDIFDEGFHYDSMSGDFYFVGGRVQTDNYFIDGVAAEIRITGDTLIKEEQFDQHIVINPKATESLPLLAAWVFDPATGAAIFLLNKMLQPAVKVITQVEYDVTGSWDEPVITQVKTDEKTVETDSLRPEVTPENLAPAPQ